MVARLLRAALERTIDVVVAALALAVLLPQILAATPPTHLFRQPVAVDRTMGRLTLRPRSVARPRTRIGPTRR